MHEARVGVEIPFVIGIIQERGGEHMCRLWQFAQVFVSPEFWFDRAYACQMICSGYPCKPRVRLSTLSKGIGG